MSSFHGLPSRMTLLAVIVAASSLLLASTAPTSSSTMSHLDASTGACIRRAAAAKRLCKLRESAATCRATFQAGLAACFSAGPGVACATACIADQQACQVRVLPAVAACRHDHHADGTRDARAACDVSLDECKQSFAACLPACAQG